jgi:hypothetical protein
MCNENSLVDIYVANLYVYGWYLYGWDDVYGWDVDMYRRHLCVWVRLEWRWDLCMDEIIAYDYSVWLYISIIMCRCEIFEFKIGVELK